jgi:hypothetical protein
VPPTVSQSNEIRKWPTGSLLIRAVCLYFVCTLHTYEEFRDVTKISTPANQSTHTTVLMVLTRAQERHVCRRDDSFASTGTRSEVETKYVDLVPGDPVGGQMYQFNARIGNLPLPFFFYCIEYVCIK